MSFCRNTSQQLNLIDPIYNLTEREQKLLVPEKFKPYLDEEHHNNTIYRSKDTDIQSRLDTSIGNKTAGSKDLHYI